MNINFGRQLCYVFALSGLCVYLTLCLPGIVFAPEISAGRSVLVTQGHRRKNRVKILLVHGGHRSPTRRWPAQGRQGDGTVVGIRNTIGQNIDASGRAPRHHQAVQPNETRRFTTKLPDHTVERVHGQTVVPADRTARRHNNFKLAKILFTTRNPALHHAQKVKPHMFAIKTDDLKRVTCKSLFTCFFHVANNRPLLAGLKFDKLLIMTLILCYGQCSEMFDYTLVFEYFFKHWIHF